MPTPQHPPASRAREWAELSALYEQADELDEAALEPWLAGLREQDHPHVAALERMLAARSQVRSSNFLGEPPPLPSPLAGPDWQAGALIGPYRLRHPLGSGGAAEVWLAERDDGAFTRTVALKLLYRHSRSRERDSFGQRFTRERDILASLNHPHIARMLDAGVMANGQPWMALEYVEGEPLTRWCDGRALPLRQRVRLFLQVLDAVQHAHANLVIHRDIKPSNILVNPEGQVRLLDFGIAKLIEADGASRDATDLTRTSGQPLTPRYASPEQIRGQALSTISDLYSLGVLLYEVLCGLSPYETPVDTPAQWEQAVLTFEPQPPSRRPLSADDARSRASGVSALRKDLANDLDAIVLKAMAKSPQARYGSALALRLDLEAWLAGLPVQAKVPRVWYRVRKFIARNRWSVLAGGLALASLMAVTTVAVVLGQQAREESARSVAARDFLIDMFRQVDPDLTHGKELTAKQLLEQGKLNVLTTLSSQPRLQSELLQGVADAQANLQEYRRADATLTEAIQRYLALGLDAQAAKASLEQANVVYLAGDVERAKRIVTEAATWYDFGRAPVDIQISYHHWQSLQEPEAERGIASALLALGLAERAFERNDVRTVRLLVALAKLETGVGRGAQADAHFNDAVERARRNPTLHPRDLIQLQADGAQMNASAGRFRLAADQLVTVTALCDQVLDRRGITCTDLRRRLAQMWLALGHFDRAMALVPSFVARLDNTESPQDQVDTLMSACRASLLAGQWREHPDWWARLRSLAESSEEAKLAGRVRLWAALLDAERLLRDNQPDAALALLQRAHVDNKRVPQLFSRRVEFHALLLEALVSQHRGAHSAALAQLREAYALYPRLKLTLHPRYVLASLYQARNLWASGQRDAALGVIDEALPRLDELLGADAPIVQQARALRAELSGTAPTPAAARKIDYFL